MGSFVQVTALAAAPQKPSGSLMLCSCAARYARILALTSRVGRPAAQASVARRAASRSVLGASTVSRTGRRRKRGAPAVVAPPRGVLAVRVAAVGLRAHSSA
ncbi:hypothetical protein GCM10010361_57530 [Streptomyces olivaceiscleroticus]|uniref:Uncharacterized protein n=1 Tax=Streptomyces olivaceiscleroticus TaxID=68245 RepID=A0ABN1AW65_9ACTN